MAFLAILGSIFIVPFVWAVVRGDRSRGAWEGEYWDRMAGRFRYIDQRVSDAPGEVGFPLAELPMFGPSRSTGGHYMDYLIWKWGWMHRDIAGYRKSLKEIRVRSREGEERGRPEE
ncbi:MAG: hypothetical protein ACE5OO_06080 [Candidatus Bathyarchaeia archaeon]